MGSSHRSKQGGFRDDHDFRQSRTHFNDWNHHHRHRDDDLHRSRDSDMRTTRYDDNASHHSHRDDLYSKTYKSVSRGHSRHKRGRHSRRRRESSPRELYEDSSDFNSDSELEEGTIRPMKGDIIDKRYKIRSIAGKGTFATVLQCEDMKYGDEVAIKVVRSVDRYLDAAEAEIEVLEKIQDNDREHKSLCVRLYRSFTCRYRRQEHVFIVFEKLGMSLYKFLKSNKYQGFPLKDVKSISRQILHSIAFCHSIGLVHTDLKPENILLKKDSYTTERRPDGSTFRKLLSNSVRVIDFGGATFIEDHHSSIINTRQYRGPEVILGLQWGFPSDVWSAACIIAELYLGKLLFATHDNLQHLALMEKILQKPISSDIIYKSLGRSRKSSRSRSYVSRSRDTCSSSPSVRGRSPSKAEPHKLVSASKGAIRWPENAKSSSIRKHVETQKTLDEMIDNVQLCSLLKQMLEFDPKLRISAKDALEHEFFKENPSALK